jgi:hypothetical protein
VGYNLAHPYNNLIFLTVLPGKAGNFLGGVLVQEGHFLLPVDPISIQITMVKRDFALRGTVRLLFWRPVEPGTTVCESC